jgi:hypothetical protein
MMDDRFYDPITLDLMNDPVLAEDGKTYDRASIEKWIQVCTRNRKPINSPLTNIPFTTCLLTPNLELKREIEVFKTSKTSAVLASEIHFTLTSEIYEELDQINSLSLMETLDLKPPKIVVIGNESHGKSTLLERIIGLPLFPKEKGICTRCLIRVHLRRSLPNIPSIAEISVRTRSNNPVTLKMKPSPENEDPNTVTYAALENIRQKVQETMNELVRSDPQRRMVLDDKEIIIKINLPYCLNIDLVDVPGLVTTSPTSTTQNLPEVTHNLALRVVYEEKDSAIFLLVNDVKMAPNQSKGCAIIQQAKLENKTMGIFTKLDTFVSEDGDEVSEVSHLLEGTASNSFDVKYGWMAAASRKIDSTTIKSSSSPELSALYQMTTRETEVFKSRFSRCSEKCKEMLGIDRIRQRIQDLYERFIKSNWVNLILSKLSKHQQQLLARSKSLGIPLPPDPEYSDFLNTQMVSNALPTCDQNSVQILISRWLIQVAYEADDVWLQIPTEKHFWRLVQSYHQIFHTPANKGQNQSVVPFDNYRNGLQVNYSSDYPNFPVPISRKRIVRTNEVQATKEKVLQAVRQLFTSITSILTNKLKPSEKLLSVLINRICQYQETFKLNRFPGLLEAIRRILSERLTVAYDSMTQWIEEFQAKHFSEQILFSEYFILRENHQDLKSKGTMFCCLHWTNPAFYHQFPHMALDKFYELIQNCFTNLEKYITNDDLQHFRMENCKQERMKNLQELVKIQELEIRIQEFSRRVDELTSLKREDSYFFSADELEMISQSLK